MLTEEQIQEAARILRERHCKKFGHDFDVQVYYPTNMPTAIRCTRCGETWRVFHPVDPPTQVVSTISPTEPPTVVMPKISRGH